LTFGAIPGAAWGSAASAAFICRIGATGAFAPDLQRLRESQQNEPVRNPDKWSPMEPDEPESRPRPPATRRGALIGLIVVLSLVAAGLALTRILHSMAQVQDCALSGRSNCPQ
jgi:hypothetical protein